VYDSPVTEAKRPISYRELREMVSKFAGVLRANGVNKGDRVVIYMPMIPEAVVAMLACARLGAVHSVVFGGFAPHELAVRIDDALPSAVVSASCGIEGQKVIPYKPLLDRAIETARHKVPRCIIYQRPQVKAELVSGATLTGPKRCCRQKRPNAFPSSRPIRSTCSTLQERPACRKGVVRDNGACGRTAVEHEKYL
jgi:propionyl-CoA synthetase